MKENSYPSFEHLPMSLNAEDISKVLNISIGNAYNLLHREDFPTIHIGKRMIVPRDRFFEWMDQQIGASEPRREKKLKNLAKIYCFKV